LHLRSSLRHAPARGVARRVGARLRGAARRGDSHHSQRLRRRDSEAERMIARRKFHRAVFRAAGAYNIAWGLYSALDPQWLFRFAGMPRQNYPEIFACLGMVVGLYGILYLEVARLPERGWLIAAVGLAGKVLGPIGLIMLIARGA